MDSSGQHHTHIQEQPDTKQVPEPALVEASPMELRLHFNVPAIGAGFSKIKGLTDWRVVARYTFFFLAALLLIGGFLYWKFYLAAMDTKSLSEGGYTYSFTFLRPAKPSLYSNGMKGFATDADHSAVVGPISGLPELCGLKGDPYALAFKVNVYGATRPVCTTRDGQDEQIYLLSFQAQGQYHEFMITYGYSQDVKVYPKLQSIFQSIEVSK